MHDLLYVHGSLISPSKHTIRVGHVMHTGIQCRQSVQVAHMLSPSGISPNHMRCLHVVLTCGACGVGQVVAPGRQPGHVSG